MYWACIRKYIFFSNVWIAITRKWSFAMNIGDKVEYYNEYKDKLVGVIENIDTIFLTVKNTLRKIDYIMLNDAL